MTNQRYEWIALVAVCLLVWGPDPFAAAQQTRPASAADPAASAPQAAGDHATKPDTAKTEAAQREELLSSECWRRAMFELNEWFRTQTLYTPQEAARIRSDFAARVETMSPQELREVIADMDAKFRILNQPELQETRSWFAQYMSVLADRKRAEVLEAIPDFPTMTASELQQAIMKFQNKRSSQARFHQGRQAQVDAQLRANQANAAARAAARQQAAQRSAYRSPYRPPARKAL